MTYLDKLLDGAEVVWKPLGEVAIIQRGASPRPIANFITDDLDGVPWIKIGDTSLDSKYINFTQQRITKEGASRSRMLKKGDFILSNSMSFGRPYILNIDGAIHDGWAAISGFEEKLNSDFLYHYLCSNLVQQYWLSKINSGSVSNLNSDIIKSLIIPIPPLSIQKEIVRILDTFTELTARKKQYEYYHNTLLTFKSNEIKFMSVAELFDIKNGLNKEKSAFGYGQPIINFTDVFKNRWLSKTKFSGLVNVNSDEIQRYSAKKGDVFFTRTSETKEDIGMSCTLIEDIPNCVFSGFVLRARPKTDLLLPKFSAYYFSTNEVRKTIIRYASFTTRATTTGPKLSKIQVPILPLEEQQRIVDILDKFDTLTTSISEGLPKEIELRKKQYEYYRDMLLSFPKK